MICFLKSIVPLKFGMNLGLHMINNETWSSQIDPEKLRVFQEGYTFYYNEYAENHALDVYAFCLSEHDHADMDGRLSMWRGYGAQGNGAAIIFNTAAIAVALNTPIFLSKVRYETGESRRAWIKARIEDCFQRIKKFDVPDSKMWIPAHVLFEIIKVFSLTSKHKGFDDEREWRVVYLPERDRTGSLAGNRAHIITSRGVEPKLRLKIAPLPGTDDSNWTFNDIFDKIILGPGVSSELSRRSVQRMLENHGKKALADKVFASGIPFRPQ